jgi:hypothetical protein
MVGAIRQLTKKESTIRNIRVGNTGAIILKSAIEIMKK